ncbi:nicotinamide riboside transporter PnuC [Lactiplantibacillus pentosus]|uniref:nicotinamide riboside transporter PnuC n=1 Tax=Lactiplantibacillus pentosus TaxID=1589 RepID=UPI00132FBAAE|nr:nicotinamide riboside transporter PnuC [Lactiplantibacillus pentosus]MBQ0835675.1 nicotinamide mononucleotide transporter [Lactiplantibacillus pentosus]MBU7464110.1 nicotinamide riboside transporter PnuC [Lactiplantibacillus pentosus]MBU7490457.1 nicotinamide riboside transporter PnuC [Lactiplantibacillus pentosus]MBU7492116.1 nicotinamide riboside transporter PnuC [Lactiplantibacillus pentosus]MBU7518030.1 nicotinamide riboside transporter PnuC [Lactiplantibacillus pentosus]
MILSNYFKFLSHQLKGWPQQNYYLFYFSLGCQVMTLVSAPITALSILTFIGTTLGVLCVLAINAAKSVNGLLGVISAACFIVVGFSAKNYLSIGEQLAYVVTLDIPVLLSANWNVNMVSKIRKFTGKTWVVAIVATLVVYAVSGYLIGALTDDPRPWVDAISFAICLTAGVICFLRYNNQYFWWIASGLAQMVLWFISFRQGSATLAMFINSSIYLINDILAFTVSPWYNKHERARLMAEEQAASDAASVDATHNQAFELNH